MEVRKLKTTRGRLKSPVIVLAIILILAAAVFGSYIAAGVVLRADVPIVRSLIEAESVSELPLLSLGSEQSWNPMIDYAGAEYIPIFSEEETEVVFFERMRDVDRWSLSEMTREFPELLTDGWSRVYMDAYETPVNPYLDEERSEALREWLLSGKLTTVSGDPIYAIDGLRSQILVRAEINQTEGFMAISYDKSKVGLSMSYGAFEGRWSTVREHLEYVGGIVAIPANDYTYNSRMGYGVVDGGFTDAGVVRYKPSGNESLYLGFTRDGTFAVGEYARYGMHHFSEGQGVLLSGGEVPAVVTVPEEEQQQVLDRLAGFIQSEKGDEVTDAESVETVQKFLESLDDYMLQARYAWIIRENTVEGAEEADALISVCNAFGADTYAEKTEPVRTALTAVGQRGVDGATFLFGIGGAKNSDVKDASGSGATTLELSEYLLGYGVTNAAVTTSGSRVGFAWKDQSLLRVRDTTTEGGRTYGAYYLQ